MITRGPHFDWWRLAREHVARFWPHYTGEAHQNAMIAVTHARLLEMFHQGRLRVGWDGTLEIQHAPGHWVPIGREEE